MRRHNFLGVLLWLGLAAQTGCAPSSAPVLEDIQEALSARDLLRFEELVDVERITGSFLSELGDEALSPREMMLLKAVVSDGVLEGNLTFGHVVNTLLATAGIPSALDPANGGSIFYGTGVPSGDGSEYSLEVLFRDPKRATDTARVFLGLEAGKDQGSWRVVGIRGAAPVLEGLGTSKDALAAVRAMRSDLLGLAAFEEIHWAEEKEYTRIPTDFRFVFEPSPGVTVNILSAAEHAWSATAESDGAPGIRCALGSWSQAEPSQLPSTSSGVIPKSGEFLCDELSVDTAYASPSEPG